MSAGVLESLERVQEFVDFVIPANTNGSALLREARATVAATFENIGMLEQRLRHEANARQERVRNFDGDLSVEGMTAQEMLISFARQLHEFADECAALARTAGDAK